MKSILFCVAAFFLLALNSFAQKPFNNWKDRIINYHIEPVLFFQGWSTYTFNQLVFNEEEDIYEKVDNRWNAQVRRMRVGIKVQPYQRLKFQLVGSFDLIGRDILSGTVGGSNNGSPPEVGLWDAWLQWRIVKNKEILYLTAGYLRPQISRESITSGFAVSSFEKSMSQNYIRRHLTGKGSGREAGLNLGGLLYHEGKEIALQYNLGIFNSVFSGFSKNSTGKHSSPLLAGRLVLSLGDPEQKTYSISYKTNYFNSRKGISLGFSGAYQGKTGLFKSGKAIGADILLNWGPLNLDGEWVFLWRGGNVSDTGEPEFNFTYSSNTGHFRLGYNLAVANKYFLEPTFMMIQFNGGLDKTAQEHAALVGSFSGKDQSFETGLNWYLNRKYLKLSIHYTWRKGDAGDTGDGATVNQFFFQNGVGAIKRGNWLGMGLVAIF